MVRLSVVVVMYEMQRQVQNTLQSLSAPYQRHMRPEEYEILLVDNGSSQPLPECVWRKSPLIRYQYIPPSSASVSPVRAINEAVTRAKGETLCIMIDGARILSPGTLSSARRILGNASNGCVEVRGWHLGPKRQNESLADGYSEAVEKRLLDEVRWQKNGYRLFRISQPSSFKGFGFWGMPNESNCLFMTRGFYDRIGGYDERYEEPGGGMANIDFFWRVSNESDFVATLLGEGTFHQAHQGAVTGLTMDRAQPLVDAWWKLYETRSRSREEKPRQKQVWAGSCSRESKAWLHSQPI